jgi:hypothetical protein
LVGIGRFGRDLDDLFGCPPLAIAVPYPDRRRKVLEADDAVNKPVGFGRVVRRARLEDELVLFAKIDLLQVPALGEVPEVRAAAIFAAEQDFRNEAVLEGVGRAPLAGYRGVVAEMPPPRPARLADLEPARKSAA